jgi:hypothetical protein
MGFMIVIPHPGGVRRIKENPGVHPGHVSITKDLIVGFSMSGWVEAEELPV